MISIGLDLSITSTGVCVYDTSNQSSTYYIIGTKITKKAQNDPQKIVNFIECNKLAIDKSAEYHVRESFRTRNIYNIVKEVSRLLDLYKPQIATIEGISFNSKGDIVGLAGLNYMIRAILIERNIDIVIASPLQNKKFATGNAQAEKYLMISAWHKMDKKTTDIPSYIKVDDIADAYFLARYGVSLLSK